MSNKSQKSFVNVTDWSPPKNWLKIKTIDAHTAGEPLRIILEGLPDIKGKTILEKRKYMKENMDNLVQTFLCYSKAKCQLP